LAAVPSFAGKVVVIGATAPSLHDIHPTPLAPLQAGVETLATAIDNAISQRVVHELPRWLQAALAIALCMGIALWVQFKSIDCPRFGSFAAGFAGLGLSEPEWRAVFSGLAFGGSACPVVFGGVAVLEWSASAVLAPATGKR
jgi:adenylate cyclase